MNEKQALDVLKAALDLGVQKGNYNNLNEAYTIIQAFDVIANQLKKDESDNESN
jgi:hypothetical protein